MKHLVKGIVKNGPAFQYLRQHKIKRKLGICVRLRKRKEFYEIISWDQKFSHRCNNFFGIQKSWQIR